MQLTKKDILYLQNMGANNEDIEQIKRAKKVLKLTNEKGERITQNKAVEILGRENFLSSLDRCAFHWTSCNEKNGHTIY